METLAFLACCWTSSSAPSPALGLLREVPAGGHASASSWAGGLAASPALLLSELRFRTGAADAPLALSSSADSPLRRAMPSPRESWPWSAVVSAVAPDEDEDL